MPGTDATAASDYVAAVEQCFVAIRGRGVLWAPEDAERALRWQATGAPLGLVVRVLQARVRAWRFRHGDHARLPMHLGWYEAAILQALKPLAIAQRTVPTAGDAAAGTMAATEPRAADAPAVAVDLPLLAELLDPLPRLIAATGHLALQHAYRKAFEQLDALQQPADKDGDCDPDSLRDPHTVLARCRSQLRKTVVAGLRDAEAATLQQALDHERSQLAMRLSRKALTARLEVCEEHWLAAHLGLYVPSAAGWIDPRDELC